ncbi:MAG: IPTL-CTERM sorting domain-containing protein [Phycisphaerae bacterium]
MRCYQRMYTRGSVCGFGCAGLAVLLTPAVAGAGDCNNPTQITAPFAVCDATSCEGNDCIVNSLTEEDIYEVTIPNDGLWTFSTCNGSLYNTFLGLGTACCSQTFAFDDTSCPDGVHAEIVTTLTAGTYWLAVEGGAGASPGCGPYCIEITKAAGAIPTLSEWGLIVMTVLLLGAGGVMFRRRRSAVA